MLKWNFKNLNLSVCQYSVDSDQPESNFKKKFIFIDVLTDKSIIKQLEFDPNGDEKESNKYSWDNLITLHEKLPECYGFINQMSDTIGICSLNKFYTIELSTGKINKTKLQHAKHTKKFLLNDRLFIQIGQDANVTTFWFYELNKFIPQYICESSWINNISDWLCAVKDINRIDHKTHQICFVIMDNNHLNFYYFQILNLFENAQILINKPTMTENSFKFNDSNIFGNANQCLINNCNQKILFCCGKQYICCINCDTQQISKQVMYINLSRN